ncbi:MAG: hypothetical protein ACPGVL_11955 [Pseudoalteromonas spongiae]
MSIATPLTAGTEITLSNIQSSQSSPLSEKVSASSIYGEFTQDVVNISDAARERQQQSELINRQQPVQVSSDVVRVSSSIGQSKAAGNLTESQASKLYKEIAALL